MDVLEPGQIWVHAFQFSQQQVIDFAKVTGDDNPVHLDTAYAATTAFKRPIVHGMLGACVFSKVFGTICPGPGSLYLSQTLDFKQALVVDTGYEARFTVVEEAGRKRFKIRTQIFDRLAGTEMVDGEALLRVMKR